ncbi:MAG: hypothetical protein JST92_17750 [Deltaproteobacteria bacterium]|nr:hypothetical protein [Deltaproteobacteria bacterium]
MSGTTFAIAAAALLAGAIAARHPVTPCGGQGQRACCVGERKGPVCDRGLREVPGCSEGCGCGGGLLGTEGTSSSVCLAAGASQACKDALLAMLTKAGQSACQPPKPLLEGEHKLTPESLRAHNELFGAACLRRDVCYLTPGETKSACDAQFLRAMVTECYAQRAAEARACSDLAAQYAAGGSLDAYEKGQRAGAARCADL